MGLLVRQVLGLLPTNPNEQSAARDAEEVALQQQVALTLIARVVKVGAFCLFFCFISSETQISSIE